MTPLEQYSRLITRRHFFGQSALGLGTAALTSLLPQAAPAAEARTAVGGWKPRTAAGGRRTSSQSRRWSPGQWSGFSPAVATPR